MYNYSPDYYMGYLLLIPVHGVGNLTIIVYLNEYLLKYNV